MNKHPAFTEFPDKTRQRNNSRVRKLEVCYRAAMDAQNSREAMENIQKSAAKLTLEEWIKVVADTTKSVFNRSLRSATITHAQKNKLAPPKVAPRLYEKRPVGEDVVEFIASTYGKWIDRESISLADIKNIDEKAYKAIFNYKTFHRDTRTVLDLIPTRSQHQQKVLEDVPASFLETEVSLARTQLYRRKKNRALMP